MAEDSLPPGEVIGIIIGAIALFSIISVVPMLIMWLHRRRAPARRASETVNLTSSMQQVSVDRWLEEQNTPNDTSHYAQDTCAICLSSLSSSPYLSTPELAHLADTPPRRSNDDNDEKRGHDPMRENCIIVLNRCHHAFHLTCLTSWFEYRRYKCPICQASYSPDETMC